MGSTFIDITGQQFNELTAIKCIDTKSRMWLWKCSCGKECKARKNDVTSGRKKSCGHLCNRGNANIDIGEVFGEWTVIDIDKEKKRHFICKCSCGKIKSVHSYDLRNGNTKSCGHLTKGTSENNRKDLTGHIIGEWTVGEYVGDGFYECKCSCGVTKRLKGTYLRTGQSKSCGHATNAFKDLTGQQFGEWKVLEYVGNYKWKCQCSCGNISNISSYDLTRNKSTNCGHERSTKILGHRFGRLVTTEYIGNSTWKCKCDCGKTVNVFTANLISGGTKSCGCLKDIKEYTILYKIQTAIDIYNKNNTEPPFIDDIAELCNISAVTIKKYSNKYGLINKFNKRFGSRAERDIYDIIISYITSNKVIIHDRKVIAPQELDIYIPDKQLAIEFNGDYWHSSERLSNNYHQQKTIECAKKDIQLISIFEHEWKDNILRQKLVKLIENKLSNNKNIIYARNTKIRETDRNETDEFCKKYHLQDSSQASIYIGEYYNNELIAVLSLAPPRFNNEYQYEIVRYCVKDSICIVGGLEKLFKYFVNRYNPESIITYIDISKFTGKAYSKIDFKPCELKFSSPNYKWVSADESIVLSRYETQKEKLIRNGLGNKDQTEREIMISLGYNQVYDCGNLRLEWKK